MTINFPASRKELAERMKTDLQAALRTSKPFIPNSYLGAIVIALAGRSYEFYLQLKQLIKEMFPDTATDLFLERWGGYVGINRSSATGSLGNITITGSASIVIPTGKLFTDSNGNQYSTSADVTTHTVVNNVSLLTSSGGLVTATTSSNHLLASGMMITIAGASPSDYNGSFVITCISNTQFTYTIGTSTTSPATGTITASYVGAPLLVNSIGTGSATNQPSGSTLTLSTPIGGLSNFALVGFDGFTGGTDSETDTSLRGRILYRYQNPHALFNAAEIVTTAKKSSFVTRVWVFNATPTVGQVTVYFTEDNNSTIIPSSADVTTVKNNIVQSILPAHMEPSQLNVSGPTPVNVTFTFTTLVPNTSAMQQAITANLKFFFREGTNVGENLISASYTSIIYQTIDSTGARVQSFTLSAPSGDVTIASGQLAVMNSDPTYP